MECKYFLKARELPCFFLVLGTTNARGVRYDNMIPQHTNYLLKRGEDKMTWGEKVGNKKRAIIK